MKDFDFKFTNNSGEIKYIDDTKETSENTQKVKVSENEKVSLNVNQDSKLTYNKNVKKADSGLKPIGDEKLTDKSPSKKAHRKNHKSMLKNTKNFSEELSKGISEISKKRVSDEISDGILDKIQTDIAQNILAEEEAHKKKSESSFDEEQIKDVNIAGLSDNAVVKNNVNENFQSDETFKQLADNTERGRYDVLNLGILAVFMLLIGMTFLFMSESSNSVQNKVEFNAKNVSTGDYTNYLSKSFSKNLPLSKTMSQGEVLFSYFYGKSDMKFGKYKKVGSIKDADYLGTVDEDSGLQDSDADSTITTSGTETTTSNQGTTDKKVQTFDINFGDDVVTSDWNMSVPESRVTTPVTTTIKLPKATDAKTTKKVKL